MLLVWVGMHYVVAPVLYNRSSIVAPAFVMAVATFVNPSLAPVWGAAFYGESVAPLAVAGIGLAFGANFMLISLLRPRKAEDVGVRVSPIDPPVAVEPSVAI